LIICHYVLIFSGREFRKFLLQYTNTVIPFLSKSNADYGILTHIIENLVIIIMIFYAPEEERTPQNIRRLWISSFVFGILFMRKWNAASMTVYHHSIMMEAPVIYEMMDLESHSTESGEGLNAHTKKLMLEYTNRHVAAAQLEVFIRLGDEDHNLHIDEPRASELRRFYSASLANKTQWNVPPQITDAEIVLLLGRMHFINKSHIKLGNVTDNVYYNSRTRTISIK
jgi:hypothetical protein